jgi:YegS/Rv2252/BmrU family lipid kinase
MAERFYCIVNPIAGSGRAKELFFKAHALLDAGGVTCEAVFTEYPGHARELAQAAVKNGEQVIVAVGGDGTNQEVGAALSQTDATLGILPFGTGNDFARALKIPQDVEAAVGILLKGHSKRVDAAMANDRFFLNVAGFGFDAEVVRYTEKYKKRFNGMFPYLMGIFQALMHLKPIDMEVEFDGERFCERAILVSACNGTHLAGGMNVAPLADPSDGLFDFCVVKDISVPVFLTILPRYIKGKHLSSPHIRYFKAEGVKIYCESGHVLNLDGELGEQTPVTFTLLKGALNVFVP